MIWDGVSEWESPHGCEAIPTDEAGIGWSYVDGKFVAPPTLEPEPPTTEELLAANTSIRDGLLAQATLAIAPLQDAVDLEDATVAETELLKKWKQYRVAVNRINLTQPEPEWPLQPL